MQETLPSNQFTDPELGSENLGDCHLYLHFSFDSLSYIVFEPKKNRLYACWSYEGLTSQTSFDQVFSKDPLLKAHYLKVKVMFSNPLFTFIPERLFDDHAVNTYLNFNLLEPDSYFQEQSRVEAIGSRTAFCVYREAKIVVNKYYPQNVVFHASSPLIEGTLKENRTGKRVLIYAANLGEIEVLAVDNGKLLFYNYFQVGSEEEFIYFPLYVVQQLWITREGVELLVGGILDNKHSRTKMLRTYFNFVDQLTLPQGMNYSAALTEKSGSLAWALVWLAQCE